MCLQLGFVIFWRKDFGAKAAHKMLVKLTPVRVLKNQNKFCSYEWTKLMQNRPLKSDV